MAGNSRKTRGRKTELLLAEYWSDVFPQAEARASALGGTDLMHTDPFAFEAKARRGLDLLAWMRQAKKNASQGDIPTLIVRMNGQGEKSMDEWFTIMTQGDLKELVRRYLVQ